MPFLAGQIIEADRLNMLQPKTYYAQASASITGTVAGADVPGCSVNFDTLTDNAVAKIDVVGDFDFIGATTVLPNVNAVVDGVATPIFAVFQQGPGTGSDRSTSGTFIRVGLGAAGNHTVKLVTTIPNANIQLNVYTALNVTVYEVV